MKAYIVYFDEDKDAVDRIFVNEAEAKKYALKSEGVMAEYDISEACVKYIKLHIDMRDTMRDTKASASFNATNVYTFMTDTEENEEINCEATKRGFYFSIDLNFPSEGWTRITVEEKGREIAAKVRKFAKERLECGKTIEEIEEEFSGWDLVALKE